MATVGDGNTVGVARITLRPETVPVPKKRTSRAVVELVAPLVDNGRFPAKATAGDPVEVRADVFPDGHDAVAASLWSRAPGGRWREHPMEPVGNDRWRATFVPTSLGTWAYRVSGWVDHYGSWRTATRVKQGAGLHVALELLEGAAMLEALTTADEDEQSLLKEAIASWRAGVADPWVADHRLVEIVRRLADRSPEEVSGSVPVLVEVEQARFSAWYELFPRSTVDGEARHGTLTDVLDRLPYVAAMGFDVLYLPPVHPIGTSYRKGRNNSLEPAPDDVGSPWAIGSPDGGHTAVHPQLGTVDDVRTLVAEAERHGLALALDFAVQCSPDHPWVTEHPSWFRHRPDGSIAYAENPPKKYHDIYPLDFDSEDWADLWRALLAVVVFWMDVGVRVFRVDNPHTKPFAFWEWLIAKARAIRPDVVFLAEAFTRPRVMERLAKLGFSQSYTYFAWRQTAGELRDYFDELATRTVDFLRPNAWPNTPDILTEQMQLGGRPAFASRAVLAATLSANWGVYGPPFELGQHAAVREGSEEYLDSEKYQLRQWDLDDPLSLAPLLTRLNAIRRGHAALQHQRGVHFHLSDNDQILCYSRRSPDGADAVLVVVNLDPVLPQSAWLDVDLAALGLPYESTYLVADQLGDGVYTWTGAWNWVRLDPADRPAHIFTVTPAAW